MILSKEEKNSWEIMIPEDHGLDNRPPVRVPNKHIIPADTIIVNKELGTGEFGVVQQGVWTNEGERVIFRTYILVFIIFSVSLFLSYLSKENIKRLKDLKT